MSSKSFKRTSVLTLGLMSVAQGGVPSALAADLPLNWQPPAKPHAMPHVMHQPVIRKRTSVDVCAQLRTMTLAEQAEFLRRHPECVMDTTVPPTGAGESDNDPTVAPTQATTSEPTAAPTEPTAEPTDATASPTPTAEPTDATASPTPTAAPTDATASPTPTAEPTGATSSPTPTAAPTDATASPTPTAAPPADAISD